MPITISLVKSEKPLTTNESDRNRGAPLWLVDMDRALANTKLQYDLIPLPYLEGGMNLIWNIPTIDYSQIEQMRLLIGDRSEPYYYSNSDLTKFYIAEGNDLEQGAALACESWASELAYDEGNYSAGGITVNSAMMAAEKRQRANELRLRFGMG